jgi:hypothetical protein
MLPVLHCQGEKPLTRCGRALGAPFRYARTMRCASEQDAPETWSSTPSPLFKPQPV